MLGRISHDEQLTTVGHLEELRRRLLLSALVVVAAFGVCFWQNHRLLHLINAPLAHQTQQQVRDGHGPLGATHTVAQSARDVAVQLHQVVGLLGTQARQAPVRAALHRVQANLATDVARLSAPPQGDRPVTLGIGEPFTTTVTVSLVFALIISLPLLLMQAYGFMIPALEPEQQRSVKPVTFAVPGLFIAGVAFGYFVVLPAAVRFFQNFNSDQFNVLVQASQYYKFAATTMLAMGLLFQVPIAIIAVTRAGVVTPRQLRRNRRYAVAACAALAAFLPGDAITMLLETLPLYLLFELGVLLADVADRRNGHCSPGRGLGAVTGPAGPLFPGGAPPRDRFVRVERQQPHRRRDGGVARHAKVDNRCLARRACRLVHVCHAQLATHGQARGRLRGFARLAAHVRPRPLSSLGS
jgi:sec-independent protein translocase protein TatC